jgi:septum formation protein
VAGPRLLLCSASPRRRALLASLGIEFTSIATSVDERRLPGEAVDDLPLRLARLKADAGRALGLAGGGPPAIALGADTVVALDDEVLGKPRSRVDSRALLMRLSGREHRVTTGVCALAADGRPHERAVHSLVRFRPLTEAQIRWLADSGDADDKAGGYAVQGLAGAFIDRLVGSPTNVIGLPLAETLELLSAAGFRMPWAPGGAT